MPDYPVIDAATGLVVDIIVWARGLSETWVAPDGVYLAKEDGASVGDFRVIALVVEEVPRRDGPPDLVEVERGEYVGRSDPRHPLHEG